MVDEDKRRRNVSDAERRRDLSKQKEDQLKELQDSIDWYDRAIRQAREQDRTTQIFESSREALLRQKSRLQGY